MQKEDVWIHTSCDQCLGECGILVHRIDGIAREIKGDPDCQIVEAESVQRVMQES